MRKLFLFFVNFFFITSAFAQQVRITGLAKDYAGREAVLFRPLDPVSGTREVIEIKNISDEGKFDFTLLVNETQSIILSISRCEGVLYIEPNKSYDIIFPPVSAVPFKRFDRSEIALDLSNLPENDLNLLIRRFNADFTSFIQRHYYDFVSDEFKGFDIYRSTLGGKEKKSDIYKMPNENDTTIAEVLTDFTKEVGIFFVQMQKRYSPYYENLFFKNYVNYSLAEIKLLSGMSRKLFCREYFENQPILYNNPAYLKCFELTYRNLFYADSNEKISTLSKMINGESDLQKLSAHFQNDSTLMDENVRTLALLFNLKSSYYEKKYSKSAVVKTLISAENSAVPEIQKRSARNLQLQLKRYDIGAMYEDFTVGNAADEKWVLSEHLTIPTYLFFFASWNTSSLKELQLLEKLYPTYKNDIQIIAVNMDDDFTAFKKYLREHRSQQFTFLYGVGDPLITEKYNIRAIPHAVLLDHEGKRQFQHTRLPSEGAEDDFKRIKLNNKKSPSGRKTWKD